MLLRLAFVGSRNYPDLDFVRRVVNEQLSNAISCGFDAVRVVSGGAPGPDSVAIEEALRFERINRWDMTITPEVLSADWSKGHGAGLERNTKIVEAADEVIAFCARCPKHIDPTNCPWNGWSHGTSDTISKARFAGKPVTIYSAP